ncbi:hypothetical protein ACFV1C_15270 [Streptomyces sp. NPDC059605]|uniref:hypothetical protein n=1 Tax=unclassified Streptomyces TaxID=2593676 RepID=UPI00369A9AB0
MSKGAQNMRSIRGAKSLLIATALAAGVSLLTACQGDDSAAGTPGPAETAARSSRNPSAADGASGTFGPGTVSYLTPGRYSIHVSGESRPFAVSDGTEIRGAGTICGEPAPEATGRCTQDDLERAGEGGVFATVVLEKGVATRITEVDNPDKSSGEDDGPTAER